MKQKNKRAVLFSTDALVALLIIFLSIAIAYPVLRYSEHGTDINADLINSLSTLKIGEIDNAYVKSLILSGEITDLNKSILEQIGEFYADGSDYASGLANEVLSTIDTDENIGIWYGNDLLASINSSSFATAENVEVESQTISGIEKGQGAEGYSARAFLSKSSPVKYFYFGGYIGNGNIFVKIDYDGEINGVELEIAVNKEFDIYINGIFSGHYDKSVSDFAPSKYLLSSYLGNFHTGSNVVEFRGDNLYIAGGYLKVSYSGSSELLNRYYFPGIEGIINLYDGFYVPGNLTSLNVHLHLDSAPETFLTIGNISVFNGSTSGEETITITDAELSSLLDYNWLSRKTIPLRFGLENVSYISNTTKNADIFSVTDLSGSMANCWGGSWWCCWWGRDCNNVQADCEACGGIWGKLLSAQVANNLFIDSVLNYTGNRVGLVGYRSSVSDSDCHSLSDDDVSLKSEVNGWNANGGTCICCGINKAVNELIIDSSPDKLRAMVVMSDGEANYQCSEQGTGNAKQDAIQAACDAFNDYNITVHAVGFGSGADNVTLQAIVNCGNGSYYYGNVSEIVEIYRQIAQDIIEASYTEQTIEVGGNISTRLYSDSYIEFGYPEEDVPYGLVITSETQNFDDVSEGILYVPENSSVLEAVAISYSGPRWTYSVEVDGSEVYNLENYGSDFISLGDPYAVNIPPSLIAQGDNLVRIVTAISPEEVGGGSSSDKVIYTIVKQFISYSKICASADGCRWNISLENNQSVLINVPLNYSGSSNCFFQPGNFVYNENDAIDCAVYELLGNLDFDGDGKVNPILGEQDLQISSNKITGIPFTWATEVQVRRWY